MSLSVFSVLAAWLGIDLLLLFAWVGACHLAQIQSQRREPFFPIFDEPLRGFQRQLEEWDGRLPRWLEDEAQARPTARPLLPEADRSPRDGPEDFPGE
jgi:hypothetical protein